MVGKPKLLPLTAVVTGCPPNPPVSAAWEPGTLPRDRMFFAASVPRPPAQAIRPF